MKKIFKNIFFMCFVFFAFSSTVLAKTDLKLIAIVDSIDYNVMSSVLIEKIEYKVLAPAETGNSNSNNTNNNNSNNTTDNSIICSGELGEFIKQIFHIVKFAVPILIIGLGIVDFIKAMTAQSQDEIKKASTKLVKRLIIGICIFVLPTIIDFLLKIAEINSELCGW